MYVLIEVGENGKRDAVLVSKTKKKLEKYIKDKGYYWSNKANCYIDDRTSGIEGGSGADYLISNVDVLE